MKASYRMGNDFAFGWPGLEPKWTSSSKDGIGTSASPNSRLWFTVSHGIINEVYYPRIDKADIRDVQFLVTAENFFSEERRDTKHTINRIRSGVPAFQLRNTDKLSRYVIDKIVFSDPDTDVLIQDVHFKWLGKSEDNASIYTLVAPHINNGGWGNNAWVGKYKGITMLFASKDGISLAVCSDLPFKGTNVGYVGASDSWQDLSRNYRMTFTFSRAENGNVAMCGEIDTSQMSNFSLYLGFGETPEEAALKVRSSMSKSTADVLNSYVSGWEALRTKYAHINLIAKNSPLATISANVLKVHQAKGQFPGALIASLSIPWGNSKSDDDLGGYHLVWPRDMVEAAQAELAIGDWEGALSALNYLISTQECEGNWPQNMWLDGKPYWQGIQLDETGFPILLASKMVSMDLVDHSTVWNMVKNAAGFLIRNGPVTQEDRWEEDSGFSVFTLSVIISALLAAADIADESQESDLGRLFREFADFYNSKIEEWTYVSNTQISKELGIEGYYVRIAPPDQGQVFASSPMKGYVPIRNRPPGFSKERAENLVSTGVLSLVRFGLRSPTDKRILDSVKVIDTFLRSETRTGTIWHRYNKDGYGEHENGDPFDGTGIGRGWPLLAGERAHFEIARGNIEEARRIQKIIEKQTSPGGMIPEQVWDSDDIPDRGLFNGKPSGSAMPLVWAHAEYLKLCRSLIDEEVFDMPWHGRKRYIENKTETDLFIWSFNNKLSWIAVGKRLRVLVLSPAMIHYSYDGWKNVSDLETKSTTIGAFYCDLDTNKLPPNSEVVFTFMWKIPGTWENRNFTVRVL